MYSRKEPSQRYKELIKQYKQLHVEGEKKLNLEPAKTFSGFSLLPQVERIKRLIDLTESDKILDYGSGKGKQYETPLIDLGGVEKELVVDYWDVMSVDCYDPGYEEFSTLPTEKYDGVISTDMLEHCPEEDVQWVVDEMFSFAEKFLFANVACYPAKKTLPNGENAHCTIKPADWWLNIFKKSAEGNPGVKWQVYITEINAEGKLNELSFGS